MDNDVNQRRVAVFHIIYIYTLNIYSRWVPKQLRWVFECLILLAALLTLGVWGYVHNTYIIHPTDCLSGITQRPFPSDTILQVEVYSNHSYLWDKRNRVIQEFVASRQREHEQQRRNNFVGVPGVKEGMSNGNRTWAHHCNFSLLDLLRVKSLCQATVGRLEKEWREWLEQRREMADENGINGLDKNVGARDTDTLSNDTQSILNKDDDGEAVSNESDTAILDDGNETQPSGILENTEMILEDSSWDIPKDAVVSMTNDGSPNSGPEDNTSNNRGEREKIPQINHSSNQLRKQHLGISKHLDFKDLLLNTTACLVMEDPLRDSVQLGIPIKDSQGIVASEDPTVDINTHIVNKDRHGIDSSEKDDSSNELVNKPLGTSKRVHSTDLLLSLFTGNATTQGIIVGEGDTFDYEATVDLEWEELATLIAENKSLYELFDFYTLKLLALDYSLLEFTRETGYLSLSPAARIRLNISVLKIYIDPDTTECFGGRFGKFLTKYFLGYDMMIISSFKNLLPEKVGSGYVKDLLTGSQYYYKVQWMGKWRYLAGLLPAMFFTLVASVLLRQIHYHVFKFLTHFRNLLNQGIPMPVQTGAQIPFLIVTYAAIGLIIVMSEALSDDSMFSVLMLATVWEVDQFYAIYCRQQTSKLYFPWFFFLYHFLPYAYFVRFNGQFWFLPFLFHWLMTQHAMLFFINHCELPGNRLPVRVRLFRPPHGAVVLPQLQPALHPQPPMVRFHLRVGGQQPNIGVQHMPGVNVQPINVPPPPAPQAQAEANAQAAAVERQGDPPGANTNSPEGQAESVTLQRRPIISQRGIDEAALAEEVDQRSTSELVSGNSRLMPFRTRRQEIRVTSSNSDHNRNDDESLFSGAGASEPRPDPQVMMDGNLSRENVREARLNRFVRTSTESSNIVADNNSS